MHASETKAIEPYRIFFPLSIFGAVMGVSLWILAWIFQKQWIHFNINPYPILHHINIMTALFLLPVIKGFIFTAIPRFTATNFLTLGDIVILSVLQFLIFTFVLFFENSFLFYAFQSLDFCILFLFIIHRFRISKVNLSGYLHFLSGGFFLGLIGSLLQWASVFREQGFLFQYGKDFIFYGMTPCIIFGIGTRMIPMIVNTEDPTTKMDWMKKAEAQKWGKYFIPIFIVSFLIEIGLYPFTNEYATISLKGIRFIICSFWIINFFHIFEISHFKGRLARTILISCYLLIIGLAGYSFGMKYSAHLAHLYLIGGLSLLVLSIMTRVILSHGGFDMSMEKKSKVFYWFLFLSLIAALTRGFVFLFPSLTVSHLAYAAILYIFAIILWLFRFGRLIFR